MIPRTRAVAAAWQTPWVTDVVGTRPGILVGEHHHPPALGSHHGVVSLVMRVRAAAAEAGQGGVDQAGMAGTKGVIVDAQPMGHAGTVVLDDHIGALRQSTGVVLAVLGLQVEDDALLAPVPLDGTGRVPEFFPSGGLDLNYLGAEVGQHHGSDAASTTVGEIEDGNSIEDLRHCVPLSVIWKIDANVPERELQCPGLRRSLAADGCCPLTTRVQPVPLRLL